TGRFLADDYVDEQTGEVLFSREKMLTEKDAQALIARGVTSIRIRSVLTCDAPHGVCAHCYGKNLAATEPVSVGEAVGIIAAQSIGEPGTQLTMRTFRTGGVVLEEDITQGLPRVEELFEARKPKHLAIISEIDGVVRIGEEKKKRVVYVTSTDKNNPDQHSYVITYGMRLRVDEGDEVRRGDRITEGAVDPHDILKVLGEEEVQNYLIQEVQRVYRLQGVDINDKHIEVIVRQMMRKVRVDDAGDTYLLAGAVIDRSEFNAENAKVEERIKKGKNKTLRKAECSPELMGITKASLATDSFLSAASFQETTRVLTDAAIKGKVDPLLGLKENVIIGKLVPAGTGMQCYNDVEVINTHRHSNDAYVNTLRELLESNTLTNEEEE
ncbi:MAG: DNA-directed RNA polymerase subunit beta', partial [Oscillospiraceae bacterium]|nr:DNA-directed RNA polymerase subunit beta' [Oscillospiraceae bacterium]